MTATGMDATRPDGATDLTSLPVRPRGLVLAPLRALRYDTTRAGELASLTSPPYDVLDADGVAALEGANEHNVVRLILPRDGSAGGQAGRDRYAEAARTLSDWRTAGVLVPDAEPALYVYEQATSDGHVQRGLVGALALSPPQDGIVLPHENTMAGPVADRLALYTAVQADLEPIFLVYDGAGGAARRAVAGADTAGAPLVDAVLGDGARHRLWALTDPDLLASIAADLLERRAVIADGHHRYATYLRRQVDAHAAGLGAGPWDAGLCLLVDAGAFGPQVHAIHRIVPDRRPEELARLAAPAMQVTTLDGSLEAALDELAREGELGTAFLLADGTAGTGRRFLLSQPDPAAWAAARPAGRSAAWAELDVAVLSALIVDRLWQQPDDVEHLGFEHDVPAALAAAQRTGGSAVLLNPTPVQAVTAVAAAGEPMPRKSTLFVPKPRTGVILRDFRDA